MTPDVIAAQMTVAAIMEKVGESSDNVFVIFLPRTHDFFRLPDGRKRIAAAARNTAGEELIVVQKGVTRDLELILQHETAHIIAWRWHGEEIAEHGEEFLNICRQVVTERHDEFCRKG